MAERLDVMVLESAPHAADAAVDQLEAAGHRAHRCHPPRARPFPCVGITDPPACPVVAGAEALVALLVRPRVTPRPTPFESGVRCAIRAGLPIVEDGPEILDAYERWVTARAGGNDVARALLVTSRSAHRPLEQAIGERIAAVLHAAAIDASSVVCRVERDGPRLHVRLTGPEVDWRVKHALAVRVLDAIRSSGRTYGSVDVSYEQAQS